MGNRFDIKNDLLLTREYKLNPYPGAEQIRRKQEVLQSLKKRTPTGSIKPFIKPTKKSLKSWIASTCGNCCKTTSPIFYQNDIERIGKALRMKPVTLLKDIKGRRGPGLCLKSSPCPFLGAGNHCSVYEDRPKACREYPHTNRKKMCRSWI